MMGKHSFSVLQQKAKQGVSISTSKPVVFTSAPHPGENLSSFSMVFSLDVAPFVRF